MAPDLKKIYQTIEDTDNPDSLEISGPFKCTSDDAWLGEGYYFWESFIDNAHWWGRTKYPNGYIICESSYTLDESCLNLIDNYEHINYIKDAIQLLIKESVCKSDDTFAHLLCYFKKFKDFRFESIRICPIGSFNRNPGYNQIVRLERRSTGISLDLNPAIQLCFFGKTVKGYKIIFPYSYVDE